jgi:hypothetical protein
MEAAAPVVGLVLRAAALYDPGKIAANRFSKPV